MESTKLTQEEFIENMDRLLETWTRLKSEEDVIEFATTMVLNYKQFKRYVDAKPQEVKKVGFFERLKGGK